MYSETQPEHAYLNSHASSKVGKKTNQTNQTSLTNLI